MHGSMSRLVPKKGRPADFAATLRAPAPVAVPMQRSERDVLASARRIAAVDRGERVAMSGAERCAMRDDQHEISPHAYTGRMRERTCACVDE